MEKLQDLFANKLFISDLGANQMVQIQGEEKEIGRYAVWSPVKDNDYYKVIEVGSDLEALMLKYQLTRESVCVLDK